MSILKQIEKYRKKQWEKLEKQSYKKSLKEMKKQEIFHNLLLLSLEILD